MSKNPKLLLLSSSRVSGGGLLEHARGHIQSFLGRGVKRLLFIPYATVSVPYAQRLEMITPPFADLGYSITSIDAAADPKAALREADAVAVSGGNTFRLLQLLQTQGLLPILRERAEAGLPYIGWSAGSNIACPTIRTTNDMPIIWPEGIAALGLVPFQINPHYTELLPPEHQGETRDDRLKEFMHLNPGVPVVALRDGSALELLEGRLRLVGDIPCKLFMDGKIREVGPDESLQFLLKR